MCITILIEKLYIDYSYIVQHFDIFNVLFRIEKVRLLLKCKDFLSSCVNTVR